MAFLIEMTHKRTHEKKYLGTVLVGDGPTYSVRRAHPKVTRVANYENKLFDTLDEARHYGFEWKEAATAVMYSLQQQTRNIDYKVIESCDRAA